MRYITVTGAAIMLGCLAFSSPACKKNADNPATQPAPVLLNSDTISIVYKADGSCLLDGQATTSANLAAALRESIRRRAVASGPASRVSASGLSDESSDIPAVPYKVAFTFEDAARTTWKEFEPGLMACVIAGVVKGSIADVSFDLPRIGKSRGANNTPASESVEPATTSVSRSGSIDSIKDLPKFRQALPRTLPLDVVLTCTPRTTMALVIGAMKVIQEAHGMTHFLPANDDSDARAQIEWQLASRWEDGELFVPAGGVGRKASGADVAAITNAGGDGWAEFGPGTGGNGHGPKSAFFGVGGNAHHVVFCVDATGSMAMPGKNGVAFDVVREQMLRSISHLAPVQDFHVVIFKEGPVLELPDKRLLPVTPENRTAAAHWLGEVIPYGAGDDPVPALNRCFDVLEQADKDRKGKQIFLLTDGAFPNNDAVLRCIRQRNKAKDVHVFTYLMGEQDDESAVKLMKDIAAETGGKYKNITE